MVAPDRPPRGRRRTGELASGDGHVNRANTPGTTSARSPYDKVVELRPRQANTGDGLPTRALRTLFVIDELDIGGTEQQILELTRRIDRRRFEPVVCCFRHGAKAREIESLGIRVLHEPKSLKADPGLVVRLARMMRRERFDIVQTYLWGANTWGRIAARMAVLYWLQPAVIPLPDEKEEVAS